MTIKEEWNNLDNKQFYEKIDPNTQMNYSQLGGLDNHSDLLLIDKLIKSSKVILEVGACYGRVIDYLVKQKYHGNLIAVERSAQFFDILSKKHSKDKIELHNISISEFEAQTKIDLILWLWSGISDFSPKEQAETLERLANFLTPNGAIVVDTISLSMTPGNAKFQDKNQYRIEANNEVLFGYTPSPQKMSEYALQLDMQLEHIPYQTSTKRLRELYIFRK